MYPKKFKDSHPASRNLTFPSLSSQLAWLAYRRLQPPLQQVQHPATADAPRQARHQRRVRDRLEVLRQIGVHHVSSPVIQSFVAHPNRIVRAPTRSVAIRRLVEV